jgi:hypothetical protein
MAACSSVQPHMHEGMMMLLLPGVQDPPNTFTSHCIVHHTISSHTLIMSRSQSHTLARGICKLLCMPWQVHDQLCNHIMTYNRLYRSQAMHNKHQLRPHESILSHSTLGVSVSSGSPLKPELSMLWQHDNGCCHSTRAQVHTATSSQGRTRCVYTCHQQPNNAADA